MGSWWSCATALALMDSEQCDPNVMPRLITLAQSQLIFQEVSGRDLWTLFNRWVDSGAENVNWDASQVDVPHGVRQRIPAPSRCHVSKAGRIFCSPFFPCPASVTQAVRVQYQAFSLHRRHCFHLTHNNGCPGTFNHTSSCSQPHSFLSLAAWVLSGFLLHRHFWLADSQCKRCMAG